MARRRKKQAARASPRKRARKKQTRRREWKPKRGQKPVLSTLLQRVEGKPLYWLMKSEPSVFSIDDLRTKPDATGHWDGVRNFMARNFMMRMKVGDGILFHHSSADPSGIAGVAEVVREAYPDHTAQDPKSEYFDPKATPENPRWFMVDVRWKETFPAVIPLAMLRGDPRLKDMILLRLGSRLSVTPVTPEEWNVVLQLGRR